MEIKNYEKEDGKKNRESDGELYELIEIIIKQKITIVAVVIFSIFTGSFLAVKENKNFKNKNIVKSIEVSKQKLYFEQAENNLIEIENRIKNIISEESKSFTTATGISELISLKYSTILREKKELESKYEKEKEKLKNISNPVKNKSGFIFGLVTVLGIFLGIFTAFFKEGIEGYKRRRK
ncbi:MAG: hypothetical protein RR864_05230 [Cetobacterium sp.]